MTIFEQLYNNLFETVGDYYGDSEQRDPSYDLSLLAWSGVLALPHAVRDADEARELAISWQAWQADMALGIGDLAEFADYFSELAERFDLTDEFRENGII